VAVATAVQRERSHEVHMESKSTLTIVAVNADLDTQQCVIKTQNMARRRQMGLSPKWLRGGRVSGDGPQGISWGDAAGPDPPTQSAWQRAANTYQICTEYLTLP
jgi:hypothetical protein